MIQIATIKVTSFEQNCRVLYTENTEEAIVVDPGGDTPLVLKKVEELGKKVSEIWLTHSHLDHAGGVASLKSATNAKLVGHKIESVMRAQIENIAKMYGASGFENCPEPDTFLEGGEEFEKLGVSWKVLFTPGHSPGHLCFYAEAEGLLIAGDTVFAGSIGRTDLPGGDLKQLLYSIRDNILVLPDEVRVLNGHGPETTVGAERSTNPFLTGSLRGKTG